MSSRLLAFYADDFTGASDVMNVLAGFGVRASVYLAAPDPADVPDDISAVGIAGLSRTMSDAALRLEVTAGLSALLKLDPAILHYKVCSTFDSAVDRGNIGVALLGGQQLTGQAEVPVVVGMPQLGRYVLFGNLFATAAGDVVHRLDRHPTMAVHPSTPMNESELGRHLHNTAGITYRNVDVVSLRSGSIRGGVKQVDAVVYDTLTEDDLAAVGRELLSDSAETRFVVGSSGVAVAVLTATGLAAGAAPPGRRPDPEQTLVLSASCSPTTARQLDIAAAATEFAQTVVDVESADSWSAAGQFAIATAKAGRSVIVRVRPREDGAPLDESISRRLAGIAHDAFAAGRVRRLVICGGDTSGEVASELGITRFDFAWPLDAGAPLTKVVSTDPLVDGLSVVFKGGQMGRPDILLAARAGGRSQP